MDASKAGRCEAGRDHGQGVQGQHQHRHPGLGPRLAGVAARPGAPGRPERAGVLYDDTGCAAWSPYGGRIEMPTLQRLADNGLTYSLWHAGDRRHRRPEGADRRGPDGSSAAAVKARHRPDPQGPGGVVGGRPSLRGQDRHHRQQHAQGMNAAQPRRLGHKLRQPAINPLEAASHRSSARSPSPPPSAR